MCPQQVNYGKSKTYKFDYVSFFQYLKRLLKKNVRGYGFQKRLELGHVFLIFYWES